MKKDKIAGSAPATLRSLRKLGLRYGRKTRLTDALAKERKRRAA